jgi:hypothetical protein
MRRQHLDLGAERRGTAVMLFLTQVSEKSAQRQAHTASNDAALRG